MDLSLFPEPIRSQLQRDLLRGMAEAVLEMARQCESRPEQAAEIRPEGLVDAKVDPITLEEVDWYAREYAATPGHTVYRLAMAVRRYYTLYDEAYRDLRKMNQRLSGDADA